MKYKIMDEHSLVRFINRPPGYILTYADEVHALETLWNQDGWTLVTIVPSPPDSIHPTKYYFKAGGGL
jgi:hypothetical protein